MIFRSQGWGARVGKGAEAIVAIEEQCKGPCGGGAVLRLDCVGGYKNMMKFLRVKTHTHAHAQMQADPGKSEYDVNWISINILAVILLFQAITSLWESG